MMIGKTATAFCLAGLLAACNAQDSTADKSKPINAAEPNHVQTAIVPLTKEQAQPVMKERHEHMEALGDATKKANNALKASPTDLAAIRDAAAKINGLAPKLITWFPAGTGPDAGKTRAKAEIWQKPEDFAIKAHDFETAANDFDVAAKSGDSSVIKTSFAALGKSCKACHDLYRAPEKH